MSFGLGFAGAILLTRFEDLTQKFLYRGALAHLAEGGLFGTGILVMWNALQAA